MNVITQRCSMCGQDWWDVHVCRGTLTGRESMMPCAPLPKAVGVTTLTETQRQSLLEAAKPLIQWLNENCHPHTTAIVSHDRVELVEGIATARTDEFLRDKP